PGKGIVSDLPLVEAKGVLATHMFVPNDLRVITAENKLRVGEFLTKTLCTNCHSIEPDAKLRALPDRFGFSDDPVMIKAYLDGALFHGKIPYMPKLPLPEAEREAIAAYIASLSKGQQPLLAARQITHEGVR
ncbi:MAG: cytochrome c, partial [Halothiobacillaceae bacterium]